MSPRRLTAVLFALVIAATAPTMVSSSARAEADDIAPGTRQLIVRLDPGVTTIDAVNAAVGTTTLAITTSGTDSYLLSVAPPDSPETILTAIAALPGVDWVVPNTTLTSPEIDESRIYAWRIYAWATDEAQPAASQYAAQAVHLAAAQQVTIGAGATVAVLDTGIQLAHPAFAGSLVAGTDFIDGDNVPSETLNGIDDDGDGQVDEGAGHGTHVAGIVHQVAPGASIMPVRVLDDDGTGTMWTATEGMYWAADHGAKIVNMSLGTHGSARPLRDAVEALAVRGVLVVAAAGNDGKDRPMFPAAAPDAVAVGSVGTGDIVSAFSNFGKWVDVVAPGENIHSAYAFPADSFAMNSGTSMATPWVAGEAALLLGYRPNLSTAQLTGAIKAGAAPIDVLNPVLVGRLGAGRIDIAASLSKV